MRGIIFVSLAAALLVSGCNNQPDAPVAAVEQNDVSVPTPPDGDWSTVVRDSPSGAFVMGNPAAPVKLIEIGAMACPVCKKFDEEGVPTLIADYVKPGKVSWEFRPFLIHGPVDLAANLVARCNGAKSFFPMVRALFKDQDQWVGRIQAAPPGRMEAAQAMPPVTAFVEIAKLGGLQDWAAPRGLTHAAADKCLSDPAMINAEVQMTNDVTNQFPDFGGTPAFALNGKLLPNVRNWAALKPYLDADGS